MNCSKKLLLAIFLALTLVAPSRYVQADDSDGDYSKESQNESEVSVSPKSPWGEFTVTSEKKQKSHPWWTQVLLWVPNRVMDFIDIFRVDVGVGPAYGAVVRLTRYGQVGFRSMAPASVRVGDFGRKVPFMVENSNEFGIGPGYISSKDRKVCKGEIGAGADVLIVGGYLGVCTEEVVDFIAGLFFLDITGDDLK